MPYCHGWELEDRAWGYLITPEVQNHFLGFALKLRGWTDRITVFTGGTFEMPEESHARLSETGIRVETAPIARLTGPGRELEVVELANGERVACEVLFAHPPQHQADLVRRLGLALDENGFARADSMTRETSIAGIFAAGDLTTRMQGAILAAASGTHAATVMNLQPSSSRWTLLQRGTMAADLLVDERPPFRFAPERPNSNGARRLPAGGSREAGEDV